MATPIYTIKAAILYRVADKSEKIEKKNSAEKFHIVVIVVQFCHPKLLNPSPSTIILL